MSRIQRTQKFNSKISDDYFYRLFSYVKKNCHKINIIYVFLNFINLYDKIEYIKMILELDALKYEEVELEFEFELEDDSDEEVEWSWLDWKKISKIKDLDKELIIEHHNKDWDWEYLSRREDLPIGLVLQYPYKCWNWIELSM